MTGWRVGYLVAPPGLAELLTGMQEPVVSCVNTPAQLAALTAVSGPQQQALGEQRSAVVLVGAQAIYLQTGDADPALAPYATDGDVAIDPSRLRDNPKIAKALRGAGFSGDTRHVGTWIMSRPLEGRAVEVKIDLMVPEAVGGPGRRGARLGPHGNEAARKSEDARRARVRAQGSLGLGRAAWDVHRARLFGRCEAKAGIEPFGSLVEQVMNEEPYASADRVFWIVDNGSSHRGEKSVKRLEGKWPDLRLIHLPAHASWLNQIEISSRKPYDGTGENCPSARCIQPSSGPPSKH